MPLDYKKAGVDVDAGDALVDWLKKTGSKSGPHAERILGGIGGFAALFQAGFPEMKSPCLVACTDGVGTKVKLAVEAQRYREVAQDLVAMCVNDLICSGARPLFFLDYYATGKLDLHAAKEFLSGVREACHQCDTALIGGETAEMPGVYQGGDFDCAGFAVGIVDRDQVLGPHRVMKDDHLILISSSGFHSNGYSLLRKVFEDDLSAWLDTLLRPTALYVRLAQTLIASGGVKALAHITGGGLDNLPRILPRGMVAMVDGWEIPYPFVEVQRRTNMDWSQMVNTLNCGVGLVAVVDPSKTEELKAIVERQGFLVKGGGRVVAQENSESEPSYFLDENQLTMGASL